MTVHVMKVMKSIPGRHGGMKFEVKEAEDTIETQERKKKTNIRKRKR